MKRTALIPLVLMMLVLSALACAAPGGNQTPQPGGETQEAGTTALPEATGTPEPTPTRLAQAPVELQTQMLQEEGQDPPYVIDIQYPQMEDEIGDSRALPFNSTVLERVNGLVSLFKQGVANNDTFMEDLKNGLYVDYTVHYAAGDLVSVEMPVSEYYVGAAHPNPYTVVMNFDLTQSREIRLGDLFIPGTNFLESISAYAIEELTQTGELEFPEGAEPTEVNYQNWNVTPDGLLITFDPYQIGSYAAGFHKVQIPFSELRQIINPDGPVGWALEK